MEVVLMFDMIPFSRRNNRVQERDEEPFDIFFDNFFDYMDRSSVGLRTDIKETEDEYILESELPGMDREDINIELNDNCLIITAQKNEVKEEENDNYVRRERRSGSYQRTFNVENVKQDEIQAEYKNGVLELVLPKKEETTKTRRMIDIK